MPLVNSQLWSEAKSKAGPLFEKGAGITARYLCFECERKWSIRRNTPRSECPKCQFRHDACQASWGQSAHTEECASCKETTWSIDMVGSQIELVSYELDWLPGFEFMGKGRGSGDEGWIQSLHE